MKLTSACEVTYDVAIDDGVLAFDGIGEFHLGTFFDDQAFAEHFPHDLAMASEREVARAIDSARQLPLNEKMVAADGDACDLSFFMNGDISTCLDTSVPVVFDVEILEGDVSAACWA